MHEYSVVQSLLNDVKDLPGVSLLEQVREIELSVGEFSGVDSDLLQLAFDQVKETNPQLNARLLIKSTPLQATCETCGIEFAPRDWKFQCPRCLSDTVRITSGDRLVLERIRVDES